MTAEPLSDVHVHAYRQDHAAEPENSDRSGGESARRPARGRVIQLFPGQGQEETAKNLDLPEESQQTLGQQLLADLERADRIAAKSDLAQVPLTPYDALRKVAPGKGEAGGAINWTLMTVAGLIRLGGVSLGWLIAQCFATRIRASVSFGVILLGILLAWVA